MRVLEHTATARIERLLAPAPLAHAEALDEARLGGDGQVSVFADEGPRDLAETGDGSLERRPANLLTVRWGQQDLGLGNLAYLDASRLTGLDRLLAALPAGRGRYDLLVPFWAAPAFPATAGATVLGASALYVLGQDDHVPSPVAAQVQPLDAPEVVRPMFPKVVLDLPVLVLSLRGELVSVAAVTHRHGDIARVFAYTTEAARGHGFGRGVLTALAEALRARGITPTGRVDLAQEGAVRMIEGAGFRQARAELRVQVTPRVATASPAASGLVQIGRRE